MPILTKLKEILDEAKVIFNHRLPTPRRCMSMARWSWA